MKSWTARNASKTSHKDSRVVSFDSMNGAISAHFGVLVGPSKLIERLSAAGYHTGAGCGVRLRLRPRIL